MANGNSVTLVGNLTRDPEMRFTPSGAGQAILGLAVSRRYQDRNNEWQEETGFYNVVCWGDMAENAQSLKKGTRVIVDGRLRQRSWETENGDKRSVVEVQADEIGPSLRWARADVQRNERKAPGEGGFNRQSAGVAAPSGGSGGGGTSGGSGGYDELGEEPF
ncbi:MAG TPA: single-stranded DNA-binding protein [Acidimicrobiia bacterium]|jgi:single-strand DNA-binding protein